MADAAGAETFHLAGYSLGAVVAAAAAGTAPGRVRSLTLVAPWTHADAHLQYVVLDADHVAPTPDGVDDATAAALPLAGLTALQAVRALALAPGETLLVNNAAGAAGGPAAVIARAQGARVLTPRREAIAELARLLGDGTLRPAVARTLGLDAAAEAHAALAGSGLAGKVVLIP